MLFGRRQRCHGGKNGLGRKIMPAGSEHTAFRSTCLKTVRLRCSPNLPPSVKKLGLSTTRQTRRTREICEWCQCQLCGMTSHADCRIRPETESTSKYFLMWNLRSVMQIHEPHIYTLLSFGNPISSHFNLPYHLR